MTHTRPRPASGRRAAAVLVAASLWLVGCAHSFPDEPRDPLERVNRAVYRFNETADAIVLRPVAKRYEKVMPDVVRRGVRNFFGNLFYPTVIVNDLLQLKGTQLVQDVSRFVINTTMGIGGIFDVATGAGLPANDEDFGQTLGYWGIGPGWYLMLPLLGPSNNRDIIGRAGDSATSLTFWAQDTTVPWALGTLNLVETRTGLLPADRFLEQQLDRYVFVRTIYLQSRMNRVYDGKPPQEVFDYGEEEDAAP